LVDLCGDGSSVFMIGLGLNKSLTGAESCRAVSLLPALIGNHRGFYYSNSRGRYIGDSSGADLTEKKPRVVSMIRLGELLAGGEFKFVYVFGMNPVLTLPDSSNVVKGFKRENCFLVVNDTHLTETAKLADVVLPATNYLEKDDVIVSDCHPFVRIARKAVETLAESMDDHYVMLQLAKLLRLDEPWVYIDPWKDMELIFKEAFIDGSFSDLLTGKPLQVRHRPMDEYQTPSGRLEFSSTRVPDGISPLPFQYKIKVDEGEFIMLNSALPQYTHTQFREVYNEIPCTAWVNPTDAEKYNLKDGGKYLIYNENGEIQVIIEITNRAPPGVIWTPRELIDTEGNIQNSLAPGIPQRIGGGPVFNTVKVKFKE